MVTSSSTSRSTSTRDRWRYCSILVCSFCIIVFLVRVKHQFIDFVVVAADDTTTKTTTITSLKQLVVNYENDNDLDEKNHHPQSGTVRGFKNDPTSSNDANDDSVICSSTTTTSRRNNNNSTTTTTPQSSHRPPLAKQLDFLHVPKTGTSFKRLVIQYLCNTTTEEEVEKIFAQVSDAKWIWANEQLPKYPPDCASSITLGHHPLNIPSSTTRTTTLRSTDATTTTTTTTYIANWNGVSLPLHGYVTLLRRPIHRIASGFVHDFHDCRNYLNNKYTVTVAASTDPSEEEVKEEVSSSYEMKPYCDEARKYLNSILIDIDDNNNDDDTKSTTTETKKELHNEYMPAITTRTRARINDEDDDTTTTATTSRIHIVDLVVEYAQCVKGCTFDLLSGKYCGMKHNNNKKNIDNINKTIDMDVVKERLSNFGFVGLTDEWKAMECSFQELYTPRIYGGNYLGGVADGQHNSSISSSGNTNTRPSLSKSCENDIMTILKLVDSDRVTITTNNDNTTNNTAIQWKEQDDPDYELYQYGKELFECNFLSDNCRPLYDKKKP